VNGGRKGVYGLDGVERFCGLGRADPERFGVVQARVEFADEVLMEETSVVLPGRRGELFDNGL